MKSGHDSDSEDEEDELEGAETETVGIRIADVHLLYYDIAFRSISQLCCKDIAKAWIRICHPKKQTSHPYNGGKSNVQLSLAEYGYLGHFTKPDYWPSDENWSLGWGCRHRESDHVKKPGQSAYELLRGLVLTYHLERLILLLHLLRVEKKNLKDGDFSLDKMKQSTEGIHLECGKHWTTKCVERLKEIYRIRDLEMQFKRGEIGEFHSSWRRSLGCANTVSDADTLVYVQMPKPRSKAVRKTPQSPVKAAGPPSAQLKREPEVSSSTMCNAPVANMGTNVQIEDEDLDLSEGSAPSIYADTSPTSSSTEEVAPDKSYFKSELCGARTIQHGLPFISSLSPTDRDSVHNPVQENWTPQTASLGRGATVFPQPNYFGCVATPGEAPRLLPSRDQFRSGSSSTQSFPNQEVPRRRYDNESAASQRAANQMRPNERFTRASAARPVGPKVEITCPQPFAASSSGLAGAFPDYSSWQTNNLWNAQIEPSIYTAVADPSASLVSSITGSFSSGYNDASLSSGLQWDTWNRENQIAMPLSHQGFDEEFLQHLNLQRGGVSYLGYQPLEMNTPSGDNSGLANQYPYTADVRTEHKFDPFSQHQRQL